MTEIELLEHVLKNLKEGKPAGEGLLYNGCKNSKTRVNLASDISWANSRLYSVSPPTHKVNGWEVPAPVQSMPEIGSLLFIPDHMNDSGYFSMRWEEKNYSQKRLLNNNQMFLTIEAAVLNQKAQAGFDPYPYRGENNEEIR